ncbi:creatininase [Vallitalea longa]|uniref:Creatininase n=1 Tax=Vallitalea longa TaxID=2936439 RepID=A0A9W5YBM3_9FIRM|nr:creatininase family protein [Vallitalea longa]GKX30507.1 creatininase [Vallitalea longa]
MSYSIFEGTMADMTYTQVEEAASKGTIVFFPIAVIEEHGPHMCLGTDVYGSYDVTFKIKQKLNEKGIDSVIVPPFYWGINHLTSAFTGSFTSKESTMKNMLIEIILCLKKWGFNRIIPISGHNDYLHNKVIIEVAKECMSKHNINVHIPLQDNMVKLHGYTGKEDYLLSIESEIEIEEEDYVDIHAGSYETSYMINEYPKLVDQELAKTLKPTEVTEKDFSVLFKGGEVSKKLIPNGYCGNPSKINLSKAKEINDCIVGYITDAIEQLVK